MSDAPGAPAAEPPRNALRRAAVGAAPVLVLWALNAAFRFPHFLNAAGVHSDAAIVGLQAEHLLRGEWSRFIWGAGYQSSFDALVIAAFFAVGGATPLMLMLAPFLGHLLVCAFAWATAAEHLSRWKAALVCLPLVFTPQAINGVVLYAPRQWSVTAVFAAVWLLGGGTQPRWQTLRMALGMAVLALSVYLDLYAIQLAVPVGAFALLVALDPPRSSKSIATRLLAGGVGLGLGVLAVGWLRDAPGAISDRTLLNFEWEHALRNWDLLTTTCLPWVTGAKVWISGKNLYPDLWQPPGWVGALQTVGAAALLLGITSALGLAFVRCIPWELRRLGMLGAGAAAATVGGFLVSAAPVDMFSARYLAPLVWMAPFALAPLAFVFRARGMVVAVIAPYVAVAALGGWLGFASYIDGPLPRRDPRGQAIEELQVGQALRERGVEEAAAQYWLSYRLSFLWHEQPVVVPLNPREDRYSPHRARFYAARTVAFVFHPSEPRAVPQQVLPALKASGGRVEVLRVAGFTVLVWQKP